MNALSNLNWIWISFGVVLSSTALIFASVLLSSVRSLRRDCERIAFLESNYLDIRMDRDLGYLSRWKVVNVATTISRGSTWREAVDNAMAGEEREYSRKSVLVE